VRKRKSAVARWVLAARRAVSSWRYSRKRLGWYRRAWRAARVRAEVAGRVCDELRRQIDARDATVREQQLRIERLEGERDNHEAHATLLASMMIADTRVQEARQASAARRIMAAGDRP
jgi:hypothetical protein